MSIGEEPGTLITCLYMTSWELFLSPVCSDEPEDETRPTMITVAWMMVEMTAVVVMTVETTVMVVGVIVIVTDRLLMLTVMTMAVR